MRNDQNYFIGFSLRKEIVQEQNSYVNRGSGCKVRDTQFSKHRNVGAEHVPPS